MMVFVLFACVLCRMLFGVNGSWSHPEELLVASVDIADQHERDHVSVALFYYVLVVRGERESISCVDSMVRRMKCVCLNYGFISPPKALISLIVLSCWLVAWIFI